LGGVYLDGFAAVGGIGMPPLRAGAASYSPSDELRRPGCLPVGFREKLKRVKFRNFTGVSPSPPAALVEILREKVFSRMAFR
jgi:hypothetical protein